MRRQVKGWVCLAEWSCQYKCRGAKKNYCGAPDKVRRCCKRDGKKLYKGETYEPSKLRVYGITSSCKSEHRHLLDPETPWRIQVRYVAAVSNQKEFAELVGCTVREVRNYASITGNPKEVKLAMAKPHTLIFIRVA